MLAQTLLLSLLAAVALAAPACPHLAARSTVDFTQWEAPTATDARSPCPGLNSLANHGILPRDGRNITLAMLTQALKDGLNVGADFAIAIGTVALDTSPTLNGMIDLDNLDKHGVIEHDGSLSRQDTALGDNHDFDQSLFNTVLSKVGSASTFSFAAAAAGRWARVSAESTADPSFVYTPKEVVLSYGETGLYLSTMGNPLTGNAPVEYVKILFEEERLPYNEGWRPSTSETSLLSLGAMIVDLQLASPLAATLKEGITIVQSTVAAVFSGQEVIPLIPCPLGGTGCVSSATTTVSSS